MPLIDLEKIACTSGAKGSGRQNPDARKSRPQTFVKSFNCLKEIVGTTVITMEKHKCQFRLSAIGITQAGPASYSSLKPMYQFA